MKATKTSKADQIRKALTKSPNQSKAALAKKLGVSAPYVYDIAKKMQDSKIVLTATEVEVANRLGIDTKTFAETKAKMDKDGVRRHPSGRTRMQAATSPVVGQGDAYEHKNGEWKAVGVVTSNESVKEKLTGTDALLAERGSRYGTFADHALLTQSLKALMVSHAKEHNKVFSPAQAEALDMIAHKIGRIVNGDPNYADSWRDIEGYAKLVADDLEFGKKV